MRLVSEPLPSSQGLLPEDHRAGYSDTASGFLRLFDILRFTRVSPVPFIEEKKTKTKNKEKHF